MYFEERQPLVIGNKTYSFSANFQELTVTTSDDQSSQTKTQTISRFGMEVYADPYKGTIELKEFPRGRHGAQKVISLHADPDPAHKDYASFGQYNQDRLEPVDGTIGSDSYRNLLGTVYAVMYSVSGTIAPTLVATADASAQSTTTVFPVGSAGRMVRVGVGSDYSDWVALSPVVAAAGIVLPAAAQPIVDGDTVKVQVTNDDITGTVSVSSELAWDVPDSTTAIDNATDYADLQYSVSGTFDAETTERNFMVEVLDSAGAVLGSFNIEGTAAAPTEPTLDLTAAPYNLATGVDTFTLRTTAYDEIGREITASSATHTP